MTLSKCGYRGLAPTAAGVYTVTPVTRDQQRLSEAEAAGEATPAEGFVAVS